jgi:hypothetical protein
VDAIRALPSILAHGERFSHGYIYVSLTVVAMVTLLTGTSAALSQPLTEGQARAIIAPWYSLFNVATRGDVRAIQEQVSAPV